MLSLTNERQAEKDFERDFFRSCIGVFNMENIESLFIAIGAEKVEGRGSRVRFHKAGIVASFHRPHPRKEAKIYQVKDARVFLERLGVEP